MRGLLRYALLLALAAALGACSSLANKKVPAPLPPPPPPESGSSGSPQAAIQIEGNLPKVDNARVARAYLYPDQKYQPFEGNLPFGLILLKKGDTARNQQVCSAFVNNLPPPIDIVRADPDANVILTYWLLKSPLVGQDLTDCTKLLANYDFSRASLIRSSYGRAAASGPIFLGLQLNEGMANSDGQPMQPYVALLDLSSQTPAQVAQATINWFAIVVAPSDDQIAAGPDYQAEKKRARGFFGHILSLAAKAGARVACAVLRKDAPPPDISYTEVAAFDPVLNKAVGTLRFVTRANGVIGFGTELIGDLFCPKPVITSS